jgi:hypothetical protein
MLLTLGRGRRRAAGAVNRSSPNRYPIWVAFGYSSAPEGRSPGSVPEAERLASLLKRAGATSRFSGIPAARHHRSLVTTARGWLAERAG